MNKKLIERHISWELWSRLKGKLDRRLDRELKIKTGGKLWDNLFRYLGLNLRINVENHLKGKLYEQEID
jgi:hypothetical protein